MGTGTGYERREDRAEGVVERASVLYYLSNHPE